MRSMDVGRYRYNFKSFCENFTYLMSINRRRMTITKGFRTSLVKTLSFLLSLSLHI